MRVQRLNQLAEIRSAHRRPPGYIANPCRSSDAANIDVPSSAAPRVNFSSVPSPMPRFGTLMIRSKADVVIRVGNEPQISEHILNFLPLVESDAADDLVRNVRLDQHFLDDPRLGVRPVQNSMIAVTCALARTFANLPGDKITFLVLRIPLKHRNLVAAPLSVHNFFGLRPRLLRMITALAASRMFAVER